MSNFFLDPLKVTNATSAAEFMEQERLLQKALQNQINSYEVLSKQQEDINRINQVLSQLMTHNLEQSEHQARQSKIREKLESRRFWINTVLSFLAAVAGIIALIK